MFAARHSHTGILGFFVVGATLTGCVDEEFAGDASSETQLIDDYPVVELATVSVGRDAAGTVDRLVRTPSPIEGPPVALDRIVDLARGFWAEHRATLELADDYDTRRLVLSDPEQVTSAIVAVTGHETADGLRVLGSDFSLLYRNDGELLGFVGHLYGNRSYPGDDRFTPTDALDVLAREQQLAFEPGAADIDDRGNNQWFIHLDDDDPGIDAERVASPEFGRVVWELRGADRTWLVDELDATVLTTRRHVAHYGNGIYNRSVRRGRIASNSNDWQKSITLLSTTQDFNTPVRKEYITADNSLCRYHLQSGLGYGNNNESFPRVVDASGTGDFVSPPTTACSVSSFNSLPCPFGFKCNANYGDGSYYRQQTYHSYFSQGLGILRSRAYAHVAPDSTWDVSLKIDEANTFCGDAGCFAWNPWHRTVGLSTAAPSIAILWHELGHYFDWTYGWLGAGCNDADESLAVQETLGDVVASLLAKRTFDPRYSQGYNRSQYDDSYHSDNGNRTTFLAGTQGCVANGEYGMGEAFHQAMWEIAFGFNCDEVACNSSATGVSTRTSGTTAAKAQAIFAHHGLT